MPNDHSSAPRRPGLRRLLFATALTASVATFALSLLGILQVAAAPGEPSSAVVRATHEAASAAKQARSEARYFHVRCRRHEAERRLPI